MYNRYVRNDQGQYARLPQEEIQPSSPPPPPNDPTPHHTSPKRPHPLEPQLPPRPQQRPPEMNFVNGLLDKLHLGDIDAGDLLLLVLLFLMFRENGDEELLIALGLLLIL